MFLAARLGNYEKVQDHLSTGRADPNFFILHKCWPVFWYGGGKLTASHVAAHNADLRMLEIFHRYGADMDAEDGNGNTVLQYAAVGGHLELVLALCGMGAHSRKGESFIYARAPLTYAIIEGHQEVSRALITYGADVNDRETNIHGMSPLHYAIKERQLGILEDLLGIDVLCFSYPQSRQRSKAAVDARDDSGITSLFEAVDTDFPEGVDKLIAAGANVNLTNFNGFSPLFIASGNGFLHIVRLLLACPDIVRLLLPRLGGRHEAASAFRHRLSKKAGPNGLSFQPRGGRWEDPFP